jgi:beta-mannosidase
MDATHSTTNRTDLTRFELAEAQIGGDRPVSGWIPAVAPGGVHEALIAAGRIPDPYVDVNERDVRWVEERDWWFRTTIEVPADLGPDERLRLLCEGLDTVVDVFVDDDRIGHHENMFRPATFDLTNLEPGSHELAFRFTPPLAGLEPPAAATDMLARIGDVFASITPETADPAADDAAADAPEPEAGGLMSDALPLATLRRKATFSWGWDFGPRVPSIGIWLPVRLLRERTAVISGHHVRTDAIDEHGTAHVTVLVETEMLAASAPALAADVALTTPSGVVHRAVAMIEPSASAGTATLTIPNAELWWTHDLGTPALHDVTIALRTRDGAAIVDTVHDRVGLRTIAIDRSPDPEGGRFFRFVLNGEPIFARGAAWLPPSMLVGSVSDAHLHDLVELARAGGMTMLRVWGGGVYEHDAFYAACDELGVLVWQDFAFACIDYPSDDPVLLREVTLEAEHQVKRLRNRASMAVWSGNNEVQLIHGFAYQGYEPGGWGWDFFHDVLPATVAAFDPTTPYWPGSPWGEDTDEGWMAVNGVLDGDRHAWEVWHGFDFGAGGGDFASIGESRHYRRYAADRGKFISEFGIHASPELGTLERWVPADRLAIHSPSFDAHNKDHPKDKHDAVLEIVTGLPTTMREYVDVTMVSQAEGLKFGIEHYRRRAPHCSGTLVWQFNDVWPGFSWSVVDYDLVPKAGYYAAARAFAPLLASFRTDGDRLELWASNAGRATSTTLDVSVRTFDGVVISEASVDVALAAGESRVVWSAEGVQRADAYAWVSGRGVPDNRLFFAEIKDVPFGESSLRWTVTPTGPGRADVTLSSSGYTFQARIESPAPGVRFSDNYLDLPDGESRTIHVSGLPDGFDPAALMVRAYAGPR